MKEQRENRRIIISGGGTGGHVFPAIAIADALCMKLEKPEILFVGALGRMEMEKVPEAGYRIVGLPIEGFRRKLTLANLKVLNKLRKSLSLARKLIRDFKPDVVVGVGGYASGPILRKAAAMGIPTLIQEQNSYAGLTNRLLAKKAVKICVAYEGMDKYFPAEKLILAGNPVRKEIRDLYLKGDKLAARTTFGIDGETPVILVLGGSLGAGTINHAVIKGIEQISNAGVRLIWQCGKYYYSEMKGLLGDVPSAKVILRDFIREMDQAYLAADMIVARAGAITISELCYTGKPAILVPSPNVAEDHQTKNAEALAAKLAAISIPDREAAERMIPEALKLLEDKGRMKLLSDNILKLAAVDPAEKIAGEVINIIEG